MLFWITCFDGGKKRAFEERVEGSALEKELKTMVSRDSLLTYEHAVSPPALGKNCL